jgi:hypothetical protein
MTRLNKKPTVLFSVLLILSMLLVLVGSCVAPVTVPMYPESAPEIVSVKINSNHQYYPPVYSTNPYTGKTTLAAYARYWPNGTIVITIKNRPFTPYTDKDGNQINIYYTIFTKITSSGYTDYTPDWTSELESIWGPAYLCYQSDTDYTVVTFTYFPNIAPRPHLCVMYEGENLYFRVQAVTGYFIYDNTDNRGDSNGVYEGVGSEPAVFKVTIPVTENKNPKPTTTTVISSPGSPLTSNPPDDDHSQQPDTLQLYIIIITVSACIIAILLTVIAYQHKKLRKNQPHVHKPNPQPNNHGDAFE